ncbi:hypothetical protein THAOC_32781, partial [Thalassiosira oceanica]
LPGGVGELRVVSSDFAKGPASRSKCAIRFQRYTGRLSRLICATREELLGPGTDIKGYT